MATGAELHAQKMEQRKLEKQVRLGENAFSSKPTMWQNRLGCSFLGILQFLHVWLSLEELLWPSSQTLDYPEKNFRGTNTLAFCSGEENV
jgi:hypothetical protein